MNEEVTKEVIESVIKKFGKFFERKLKEKGTKPFHSMLEIFGKLQEELFEVTQTVHKKDIYRFRDELFDVAMVALFGIMSIEQNDPTFILFNDKNQ